MNKVTWRIGSVLIALFLTACGGAQKAPLEDNSLTITVQQKNPNYTNDEPNAHSVKGKVEITGLDVSMQFDTGRLYRIDEAHHLLDFTKLGKDDFYQEEGKTFLTLQNGDVGDFSQLFLQAEDGSSLVFSIQDGRFQKPPVSIALNNSEISVDEVSGLYSISFEAELSNKIRSGEVLSFMALIDTDLGSELLDSGDSRFDKESIYEWGEDFLRMHSFALGSDDPQINHSAICIELAHATPDKSTFVCSNMY